MMNDAGVSEGTSLPDARNLKLTIEYDGTDFAGSQAQSGQRTVQETLETALDQITGKRGAIIGRATFAGRTDTGVHALGQVANVHTTTRIPTAVIARGLNSILPRDMAVVRVEDVGQTFNARFDAVEREYIYRLISGPRHAPLMARTALILSYDLDVAAMREACGLLVGEYDFASFAGSGMGVPGADNGTKSTVRRIHRADIVTAKLTPHQIWALVPDGDSDVRGEFITVHLAANAFLPQMIRTIIGTLLLVGQRRMTVAEFGTILAAADRRLAGATAPPQGLTLVRVRY